MFFLNLVAVFISIYFISVFLIIHLMRRDLSFSKQTYSKYALGGGGILVKSAFILTSINEAIIAVDFFLSGYLFAAIMLATAGIGMFLIGFFDTDESNYVTAKVHTFGAGTQFLFFPLALLLKAPIIYHVAFNYTFGFLSLSFLTIITLRHIKYSNSSKYALSQKLYIIITNVWLFLAPLSYLLS